ncbi:MAG: hypothetical protein KAT91_00690 [Candidatus Aenigmarchaeota archaeon]|nr:hypothetical protein [Candidatus Aenigmarchaeota archaeon]
MTIYIAASPIGIIAVNEQRNPISFISFKNDAKKRADELESCGKKAISDSEKKLLSQIKAKDKIIFETKKEGYEHEFPNHAGDYIRLNMLDLARKNSILKEKSELLSIIHETNTELTVRKMRNSVGEDKLLLQAINTTDELAKQVNTMSMRLREWYGYYFPELVELTGSNENLAKYVSETLFRTDVKGIIVDESMGVNLKNEDLEEIKKYAKKIIILIDEKKELEKYIERKATQVAPNMTGIVGGLLVSRLIAHAGTLEKLAGFPSSTIQILGAEKALFRYLKGAGTSPKHGLIFQSSFIQRAPNQSRGKIARTLASKLSLAAKMDFYKHKGDLGKKYKNDIEEILKKEMAKKGKGKPFSQNKKQFNKNKKFGKKRFSQKRR